MVKPCVKCGAVDRNKAGKCRSCRKVYQADYEKKHKAERKKYVDKWYAANTEKAREGHAKYRVANAEKEKARAVAWATTNPERMKELQTAWKVAHPENKRVSDHKRRAQKKKSEGLFTITDIRAILERQRGKCVACRADISKVYHIDHIMPLALGGGNGVSNIELLCPHCNLSKKDKHPVTFMQSMGFLL